MRRAKAAGFLFTLKHFESNWKKIVLATFKKASRGSIVKYNQLTLNILFVCHFSSVLYLIKTEMVLVALAFAVFSTCPSPSSPSSSPPIRSQGNTCWCKERVAPVFQAGASDGLDWIVRACLLLLSPSALHTRGSGSLGLRGPLSVSGGQTSLSGLLDLLSHVARQPVSLSGGGESLVTVSETNGLFALHFPKQPTSVSASAGERAGFVVGARPLLSAVL